MQVITHYLIYASHVAVYAEFHRPLAWLLSIISTEDQGIATFVKFAQRQIAARNADAEKQPVSRGDILSKLLQLHAEDPEKVSMGDIFTTCMTNVGAGSDTTSISLSSVFYHLCRSPTTLAALRAEIDDKLARGELSDPVTMKEAQSMPYLQAVLKEALRVHPATGFPLARVVPNDGTVIAGRVFPKGVSPPSWAFFLLTSMLTHPQSIVGINSWVAHANIDVWGPDAGTFRPERWLVGKEEVARLDKYFFTARPPPPLWSLATKFFVMMLIAGDTRSLGWAHGPA